MTPDQHTPDPTPPAADAYDWWPEPPPFTPEEIAGIEANGVPLSDQIAELEAMMGSARG